MAHARTQTQSHMTAHAHARRRSEKQEIEEAQTSKGREGGVGERRRYSVCAYVIMVYKGAHAGR